MAMKDFLTIVRRNFISVNVLTIYALALILLILGEKRDALFLSGVITVNTVFATIQEIRAKRALKKLELLTAPKARLLQIDGTYQEVPFDVLKVDDEIKIQVGDEVPADGRIISSFGLEVDEGILTGESISIEKQTGSLVKAGSVVVAGYANVKVKAVGANSMAGKMTATLKRYNPVLTPTQQSISTVINWVAYAALVLLALIYVIYAFYGYDKVRTS
jgi:cation-transporting ATPase E